MNNPLVSIITPTYNRADLLNETIKSVLKQTYKNFELIIADDGSEDNTEEMVKTFEDPRIVYLYLEHTGIPALVRNRAIDASKGNYIALLDSDDLWIPHKLERCLEILKQNSSMALVCSNEFLFKNNKTTELLQKKTLLDRILFFNDLIEGCIVSSSTVIVRKKVLENVGLFDESIKFRAVEDYHLWLRISLYYPIYYLNEPLGYCRIHDGNISADNEKSFRNLRNIFFDLLEKQPNTSNELKNKILKRKKMIEVALIKYYIKRKNFSKSFSYIKEYIRNLFPL